MEISKIQASQDVVETDATGRSELFPWELGSIGSRIG